ncbi:MAG: metallophosphoesterase [Saprospiraceae bacterium]
MSTQYAIGDIHGCLHTFEALLDQISLTTSDELFLLGDYIDRGWNSKGVIDKIIALRQEGYHVTTLRGNHEQMLIDSWKEEVEQGYRFTGDEDLLQSFGARSVKDIPTSYIDFCHSLPYYHTDWHSTFWFTLG